MSEHTPAGAVRRCDFCANDSQVDHRCEGGWVPVDTLICVVCKAVAGECPDLMCPGYTDGDVVAPYFAVVCPGDEVLRPDDAVGVVRGWVELPNPEQWHVVITTETSLGCTYSASPPMAAEELRLVLPLDTPYRRAAGLVPPT